MAGVIIPILIITALVASAAIAGALIWKFQPWNNVPSKENADDGKFVLLDLSSSMITNLIDLYLAIPILLSFTHS